MDDTWTYTQPNLPHRTGHLINPNPRITVNDGNTQPQADFRNPYLQHQQPRTLNLNTQLSNLGNQTYAMGGSPHLEPSPIHTPIVRHDRTPSLNSASNMPTPVSIAAGNSPRLSPVGDNRRHSLASSPGHLPPRSEGGSSLDGDDEEFSARRTIQYRRTGEPPRNDNGKMCCDHKGCNGITFERKCEWR